MNQPRIISPAVSRRWRRYDWLIVMSLASAIAYLTLHTLPPDPPPQYIDTAYPVAGFTCPAGYDGPEDVAEHVVRCSLHVEAK